MDELEPAAVAVFGKYRNPEEPPGTGEREFSQAISLKRIADALEKLVSYAPPEDEDESAELGSEVSDSERAG